METAATANVTIVDLVEIEKRNVEKAIIDVYNYQLTHLCKAKNIHVIIGPASTVAALDDLIKAVTRRRNDIVSAIEDTTLGELREHLHGIFADMIRAAQAAARGAALEAEAKLHEVQARMIQYEQKEVSKAVAAHLP